MLYLRAIICLAGAGLIIGCGDTAAPTPSTSTGTAVVQADGKNVFEHHCAKCHALNGEGGGEGGWNLPPDLSKVGGSHSKEWLAEYIKDPKKLEAGSKMPAFEKKLTPQQVTAVSEYLAGMK